MRNRGYKYIIKNSEEGFWLLCINATWINHMLKERGIRPKDFRKLTWEDLASVQNTEVRRKLFMQLKPANFWQMCDTLALSYAEYETEGHRQVFQEDWFYKYPLFTLEDIYEILMEKDFQQEDAIRVMEVVRRGKCCMLKLGKEEFMQLYDVPEEMIKAMNRCKYLPQREKVVYALLDSVERAIHNKKEKNKKEESR